MYLAGNIRAERSTGSAWALCLVDTDLEAHRFSMVHYALILKHNGDHNNNNNNSYSYSCINNNSNNNNNLYTVMMKKVY